MNWAIVLQALITNLPEIISIAKPVLTGGVTSVGAVKVLGCKVLQEALNLDVGAGLALDGSYGPSTDAAVQQALAKLGISGQAAAGATTLIKLAVVA